AALAVTPLARLGRSVRRVLGGRSLGRRCRGLGSRSCLGGRSLRSSGLGGSGLGGSGLGGGGLGGSRLRSCGRLRLRILGSSCLWLRLLGRRLIGGLRG